MALKYLHKKRLFHLINKYNLFDKEWYAFAHADVARTNISPYQHYYRYGVHENRDPNPLFSSQFYLDTYPDVKESGIHPLYHYVFFGGAEGRRPHPLIAPQWLSDRLGHRMPRGNALLGLLNNPDMIGPRPLFDIDHMRCAQNQPAGTAARDVMAAYFLTPPQLRVTPNSIFNNDFVRKQAQLPGTADAVTAYVQGHQTGVQPHPLFDGDYIQKKDPEKPALPAELTHLDVALMDPRPETVDTSPLFDVAFYKSQSGSESDRVEMPLFHYLREGWKKGLDPSPWFDNDLYISRYLSDEPDTNPLMHYGMFGRSPNITLMPRFPDAFYTMRFPKVLTHSNKTPLAHYITTGQYESRVVESKSWSDEFVSWSDVQADIIAGSARFAAAPDPIAPDVTVIIPVYNQFHYTLRCIWSILRSGDAARLQIIVADDGSQDETNAFFSAIPQITYIRNPENLGFLKSCNHAALSARAEHLFFLNNDTAVLPGWIDSLLATAKAIPEAGLIGSKLLYPDCTLQEAGAYIWSDGSGANLGRNCDPAHPGFNMRRDVDYVSGAAILVPTAAWTAVGGFDLRFAPAYYEDTDLAFRLRNLGWRVMYQPGSVVVHFEGVSSGTSLDSGIKAYQNVNKTKFVTKWAFALEGHAANMAVDPMYVPRQPRPRILIIDGVVPDPDKDAGSIITKWYMQLLIEVGYDVTFVANNLHLNGRAGKDLQAMGVQVLHLPYVNSLLGYIETHYRAFDLFMLYRYGEGGAYIENIRALCPDTPIIFNTIDLHHLREERQARQAPDYAEAMAEAHKTRQRELRVIGLANETILLSEVEVDVLRRSGNTDSLSVIPLVMTTNPAVAPREGRRGIAFVGGYQHVPNVDAVLYFIETIWPLVRRQLPDLVLHIAGSNAPPQILGIETPGVVVHGFIQDLDGFLDARIATIAPLRFGAGIKGKVASSLAAGVPCVATTMATEGMGLVQGHDVLIADAPQDFADAIIRLCNDPGLWSQLSQNGLATIAAHYSPDVTRRKLLGLMAKTGVVPFSGTCPLTGQPEQRRFLRHDRPASLSCGVGAPDTTERIAAIALARIAGQDHGYPAGRALARLNPGDLPAVAVMGCPVAGALPNLQTALAHLQAAVAPDQAEIAVIAVQADSDAGDFLTNALARLSPLCRRIILIAVPVGTVPATARLQPQALAPLVLQLEAARWEVRLDQMPAKESALTGVVLIEARRA